MNPATFKVYAWAALGLLALAFTRSRTATGSVELGIPTVTGAPVLSGTDIYFSDRVIGPSGAPLPAPNGNPGVDPAVREAIDRSNAALAVDDSMQGIT